MGLQCFSREIGAALQRPRVKCSNDFKRSNDFTSVKEDSIQGMLVLIFFLSEWELLWKYVSYKRLEGNGIKLQEASSLSELHFLILSIIFNIDNKTYYTYTYMEYIFLYLYVCL